MSSSLRARIAVLLAVVLVAALVPAMSIAGGVDAQVVYAPDMYEPDDDPTVAVPLYGTTYHNFDNDLDVDFAKISAETTGQAFMLETVGLDGMDFDSEIHVWSVTTTGSPDTDLENNDDSGYWADTYGSTVYFEAPAPGDYLVQIIQNSDGDMGSYMLTINKGDAKRIAGANRYETAGWISRHIYPQTTMIGGYGTNGPEFIVLASGMNFADALAGASFAMQNDGVLLLTDPMMLTQETADEIDRLTYSESADVYVLGGVNAISPDVVDEVGRIANVANVYRVSGDTRFETALAIADETSETVSGISSRAFVVNGRSFPDGLAVGPIAAFDNSVVLMTEADDVPDSTMDWIADNGITEIVLLGGTAAANDDVFAELASEVTTASVTRVAGANRYQTAMELGIWAYDEGLYDGDGAIIATGMNWPDGLAAGTISWSYSDDDGCPLLFTDASTLSTEVAGFFTETGDGVTEPVYVIAGPPRSTQMCSLTSRISICSR